MFDSTHVNHVARSSVILLLSTLGASGCGGKAKVSAAVDALESAVSMLRLFEGRVQSYASFLDLARKALVQTIDLAEKWQGMVDDTQADIDEAVATARAAFADWRGMAPKARGRLLWTLGDAIAAQRERLGLVEALQRVVDPGDVDEREVLEVLDVAGAHATGLAGVCLVDVAEGLHGALELLADAESTHARTIVGGTPRRARDAS